MIKQLIILILLIFSLELLNAQNKVDRPINFSLWNPVSTAPYDSLYITNVTLGFTSKTSTLNGVGINLCGHFNEKGVNGLSLNGVGEFVKGNMNGLEISGLFNVVSGHMHGLQVAIVQNTNILHAKGVMLSGITNFTIGNARGVQLAGVTNMAGSHFSGLQTTLGINIASSSSNLFQLAGLVNICAAPINGVQVGMGNYASGIKGLQLGLLNLCGGEVRGLQMGIINYSEDTSAVKVGLVNINPKTQLQMLAYGGNMIQNNLAVRFKSRYTYTIFGIGTNYLELDNKSSGALFYRIGLGIPIKRAFFISTDAGFFHIENFHDEDHTDLPNHLYSLQLRFNMEYHPIRKFGLFASGGYACTRYYGSGGTFENQPIVEFGFVLF